MLGEAITVHPITGRESEAQCINLFLFISSLPDPVIMAHLSSLGCRTPVIDPQEYRGKLGTSHPLGTVGTVPGAD